MEASPWTAVTLLPMSFDGFVELVLAAAGDEDVGAFFDEELGGGEGHAGGGGGDDGYFSFELTHDETP